MPEKIPVTPGGQSRTPLRAVAAAFPVGIVLVSVLFVWLRWYASGAVVHIT